MQSYMPFIDFEATRAVKEMLSNSKGGTVDLDPNPYFQRYALSTSLTLNYGIKIEGTINDELLKEITHVEREISNFRSTSNNWQDYIPLMRLWPSNNVKPLEYKRRRGAYMSLLLGMLKKRIAEGTDKPCITGNILKDPEAKLSDGKKIQPECLDQQLMFRSRDHVDLPDHGQRWSRYSPRKSGHVLGISVFRAWPRDPGASIEGDQRSISRQ